MEILSKIDHAVLKPEMTDKDLKRECEIAKKYGVASVCVKPCHVKKAVKLLDGSNVKVSTVIGFPHGAVTTACKVKEAKQAIKNGATELDMVINIGKILSAKLLYIANEIRKVVDVAHKHDVVVKIILETALLDEAQIAQVCRIASGAHADYVKTSTGFNGRGASLEDISLMKASIYGRTKIKASGGIKTFEDAYKFIQAGCDRIGTSSTEVIAEKQK